MRSVLCNCVMGPPLCTRRGEIYPNRRIYRDRINSNLSMSDDHPSKKQRFNNVSIDTAVVGNNPDQPDPYGATSIPIYQSATFAQPSATTFGDYDYSRSGNPTRSALQNQIALLEGVPGAKSFTFGTGMAAIAAISRLACAGDEVIVNDDSYGGTYRVMSKVATRMGILVKYINMAGATTTPLLNPLTQATMYLTLC
jgi:O-acetylhomoserine/O-acetylserine sulfhydrylase-like pyridoxal-dependent enzyme